jgi:hypothetical protein
MWRISLYYKHILPFPSHIYSIGICAVWGCLVYAKAVESVEKQ